ncbi:MAG TPA: hypothetical protein VEJ63_11495 [Planctomycetota bacterium]|nr:hypothetical protein [Planctomycetota bacterium]
MRRARVPAATLRHLLLDQVLPLVLGADGKLVLHASSIAIGSRAIGFLGPTGRGKSTLSAAFIRAGAKLVCDDSLVLIRRRGVFEAVPSYPDIRLWPDTASLLSGHHGVVAHYSRKVRIARRTSDRPVRLRCLFLLGRSVREISLTRLAPQAALKALLPNVFRLMPYNGVYMRGEFLRLTKLIQSVPVYELTFPRHLKALPEVRKSVLQALASEQRRVSSIV